MFSKIRILISLILLSFLFIKSLSAQPQLLAYTDIGRNNVSSGLYFRTAELANYQFGKYGFEAGLQMDLISNYQPLFSAFSGKAGRQIIIKEFPFDVQAFYIYSPFSDDLRETNWGVLVNVKRNHFAFKLGTNFRTFAYNKSAAEFYGFDKTNKIHENWNLIYSLGYFFKPAENPWNIGLSVTNIDHFLINQETNPVINLRANYKVSSPVELFMETWYKSAGAFNLSVNYFGFFVRTGIVWDIN